MMHGNQNVKVNEKNGGMAGSIFRASVRIGIALAVLILAGAFYLLLRA